MGPIGPTVKHLNGDSVDLDLALVGERLRAVRGRLTQSAFAERLDIERKTVGRYESGERAPDALALLRLMSEFGADPAWVLTGSGSAPTMTEDERELIALYRAAPLAVKMAAVGALKGGGMGSAGGLSQVFHGPVRGAVAARDVIKKRGKR